MRPSDLALNVDWRGAVAEAQGKTDGFRPDPRLPPPRCLGVRHRRHPQRERRPPRARAGAPADDPRRRRAPRRSDPAGWAAPRGRTREGRPGARPGGGRGGHRRHSRQPRPYSRHALRDQRGAQGDGGHARARGREGAHGHVCAGAARLRQRLYAGLQAATRAPPRAARRRDEDLAVRRPACGRIFRDAREADQHEGGGRRVRRRHDEPRDREAVGQRTCPRRAPHR